MSMLARFSPFRAPARFDPLADVDDMLRTMSLRPLLRDMDLAPPEMRLDVHEDDKAYRVRLDIPGAKKDDIDVTIDGGQVTVQAVVEAEQAREDRKRIYSERYSGRTFRSFTLPQAVDRERCEAQYDNGVLTLVLPKNGDTHAKRLAIQ